MTCTVPIVWGALMTYMGIYSILMNLDTDEESARKGLDFALMYFIYGVIIAALAAIVMSILSRIKSKNE